MNLKYLWRRRLGPAFILLGISAVVVKAGELTAFDLIREGNRYIGEQAKDKVVQIRSEKSVGGWTPTIWHVTYHDATAAFKATEVKFGAGKMLDVSRPLRLLEPITGTEEPLNRNRLQIDSDKALKIALHEPLLARVKVVATALKLSRKKTDGLSVVVWTVKIWAAKTHHPDEDASVGEVEISAWDGKVIRTDLNISRVE